jgi:AraC-like DNA-binding protein
MTAPTGSPLDPQPPVQASYREYAPSEKLRPFVECFWSREPGETLEPASPSVHRVLPDGCIDVVLGFSGRADEPESAMAVGTMTRALVLDGGAWPECFVGVRFRPGKAAAFLTVPANELTDLRVPIDDLWIDAGEVRDALSARAGSVERLRALERVLAARVSPSVVSDQHDVDEAIRRIVDAGGSLGITRLAPALGVTRQHLARRFSQLVGVSPKTFARVVRLGRVIERARAVPPGEAINWSALALDVGYYDQSHLVDEFKELTGVSPTVWHRG